MARHKNLVTEDVIKLYRSLGENIPATARQLGVNPMTVRHHILRMRKNHIRTPLYVKKPAPGLNPLLRQLLHHIRLCGYSAQRIGEHSGVDRFTIARWFEGKRAPKLDNVIAVGECVGLKLVWQEIEE